jgi:hypothetical protein
MKHLIAISALSAFALGLGLAAAPASAQSSPPALPTLTQPQMQDVNAQMDAYRRATDARVARNEISADEAARLVQWREWQIAQQVASARPPPLPAASDRALPDYGGVPPDYRESAPPDYRESAPPNYRESAPPDYRESAPPSYYPIVPPDDYAVEPAPPYAPYYRPVAPYYPYYYGPRPYAYWGPSVCAGGFGRHFGGRICF